MIPEPPSTLGLWPLVKDASLGWPGSDEDMVRALAEAWRAGARGFAEAATFDSTPAAAFWPDRAGQDFHQRVRAGNEFASARSDDMQSLSNQVDHFADVVIGVKSAIRDLIVKNLNGWDATRNLAAEGTRRTASAICGTSSSSGMMTSNSEPKPINRLSTGRARLRRARRPSAEARSGTGFSSVPSSVT